jgi:CHAT domain-containing protein
MINQDKHIKNQHPQQFLKIIVKKITQNIILFTLAFLLVITPTTFAKQPESISLNQAQNIKSKSSTTNPEQLLEQGEALYQTGNLKKAIAILEQAAKIFQQENNNLGQAAALTNLSLIYQKLGNWEQANTVINQSLNLLGWDNSVSQQNINKDNSELWQIIAQTLDIRAGLLLKAGNPSESLEISQQTEQIWGKLGDRTKLTSSRINQAQASRVAGFYRRSLNILKEISQNLQAQPDSPVKVAILRTLGNTHQQLGNLEESQEVLLTSLDIARSQQLSSEIALIQLNLGNTFRLLDNSNNDNKQIAINYYQQAAQTASNPLTKIQAQINQLSLLVEEEKIKQAKTLVPKIQSQLSKLPENQAGIYARINFARTLTKAKISSNKDIAQILATGVQQAKNIGDERAQSYALGSLGEIYEQSNQSSEARNLTQKALFIAQKNKAPDIAYLWEWQLGRLLKNNGNIQAAISAYDSAVVNLNSLRTDLTAVNREVQFNFRDTVEPIYRESVELLLQPKSGAKPDLDKVRKRIEALQLAELDNYFREACLNNKSVPLDEVVDRDNIDTAIFYPIILGERLEIILKLPNQQLIHKTSTISSQELEKLIAQMRDKIVEPDGNIKFKQASIGLYNLLIKPIETELNNSKIKTLVFIPDGSLRNIPMAALYDGEEYLVQNYAIAISPGLQLFTPKSLTRQKLNALAGGLSKIPENKKDEFSELPYVTQELTSIQELGLSKVTLYNNQFTTKILSEKINDQPFQVLHFATHGQFSSNPKETFILASDKRIEVAELDDLLKSRELKRAEPIELLVLSACETATGDNRAALGLAGVALSAGARSTLASLWQIGDDSTAYFINEFYKQLISGEAETTAEALRAAQLKLLEDRDYNRPMFWAAYVLVGNWL